jgi:hydroxymethylbilane synthase
MTLPSPGQHVWSEIAAAAASRFTRADPLRLGGRGSAMSMAQLADVEKQLKRTVPGLFVRIVPIKVAADTSTDRPAVEGKAVYTDGIDQALAAGDIHAAVHCEKDLDGEPTGDFVTGCRLIRGNVRDAVVSRDMLKLNDLPAGAVIGTSAPRRAAQIRAGWPHLQVQPVKGNVDGRIARLREPGSGLDALIVSWEGLCRLRMWSVPSDVLDVEQMAPAVGSAVVTVQALAEDQLVRAVLAALNHAPTDAATRAERAMLSALNGNCASPISGHCVQTRDGQELSLTGKVFAPDGSTTLAAASIGIDPQRLGTDVAEQLMKQGAEQVITATTP